ncbi:hemerythrin domain-containing protein [Azospirillum sp. sgz302134]
MTIAQLIQAAPAKANELFVKLAETSSRAVKTRERLLAELRDEIDLQIRLEQERLFPALRRHKELKDLVTDAAADTRQARALLDELEAMPKDDDAFADKVVELRRVFQQHIRDERKELLPAIRKVLSDEEAQAVADRIDARRSEIEEERNREPEPEQPPQQKPAAKAEPEGPTTRQASAAIAQAAGRAVEQAPRVAEKATESAAQVAAAFARTGARKTAETAVETAVETGSQSARQAFGTARSLATPLATPMIDGFETLALIPGVAASATTEASRVWADWFDRTVRLGLHGAQDLARTPTLIHAAELHRHLMGESMRAWFDTSSRLMTIALHASRDMLAPIERQTQRMKDADRSR